MKAIRTIIPVLLTAVLSSCSVKEDRDPCPCLLDIFLEDCGELTERLAVSAWGDEGRIFLDRIDTDQYPEAYQKKVPKGYMNVCAYGGVRAMSLKGNSIVIPDGQPCDPVWAYRGAELDATGETAEDHVVLHKQYAVVHVRLDSLDMLAGDTVLRAVGTANGFDIATLEPVKGPYHSFAAPEGDLMHQVSVPRQHDDSLELEVYLDGVLSRKVRIGEMIANAGYSWTKEDLDDIYITLGLYTSRKAVVSVDGWNTESFTFEY